MKKREKNNQNAPLIRVRPMLLWITLILVMISGPLLLVWKQVYISTTSIRMDAERDSLAVFQKEIANLKLIRNRLASTERIEHIGRDFLGLEYPATSQIYVIHIPQEHKSSVFSKTQDLVAFLRKVIAGERG
jgi:cell division protein FtsL